MELTQIKKVCRWVDTTHREGDVDQKSWLLMTYKEMQLTCPNGGAQALFAAQIF